MRIERQKNRVRSRSERREEGKLKKSEGGIEKRSESESRIIWKGRKKVQKEKWNVELKNTGKETGRGSGDNERRILRNEACDDGWKINNKQTAGMLWMLFNLHNKTE